MKQNRNLEFRQKQVTSRLASIGINNWENLIDWVRALPYGRNQSRNNPLLVLEEMKGTCSTKHAFLKMYADENDELKKTKLVIGIFKMNELNTPQIAEILKECGLAYLPEAHCYLISGKVRIDATKRGFNIADFEEDILKEVPIEIEQIGDYKVDVHKAFLKNWHVENKLNMDLEDLWKIREKCIDVLSIQE
ncbi:MAG: hypothetical protein U0V54_11560 [Saprospiraceae bacterium]